MGAGAVWFGKNWDHKLKIKHIWGGHDATPPAEDTWRMAQDVAKAIENLRSKLGNDSPLAHDLDNCAEAFYAVDPTGTDASDDDVQKAFNDALDKLYDECDWGKRVWVE